MSEQIYCPICGQKIIVTKEGKFWDNYFFFHDEHKINVRVFRTPTKKACEIPKQVKQ